MDELITRVLERAVRSLGLDAPLHPWALGLAEPPLPIRWDPVLAPPCPLPYDLDPELILAAFSREDRLRIAAQMDSEYAQLRVLPMADALEVDATTVVRVQLGVPLMGRDRVLLRILTTNFYGDRRPVSGDFHAWLEPDGEVSSVPRATFGAEWPEWVVGRSPGLSALVDLNTAPESELMKLPGIRLADARALVAARPFASVERLAAVPGIDRAAFERLRPLVHVPK